MAEPKAIGLSAPAERALDGKFAPGNKAAVGHRHPLARRASQIKALVLATVSDDDIVAVVRKLVELARGGDLYACRELLDRLIGRPTTALVMAEDDATSPIGMVKFVVCHSREEAEAEGG